MDNFCSAKEAVTWNHQNTKENTGKSMKNVLYVYTVVCQKAPFRLK